MQSSATPVQSKITAVTVYADRARITRTVTLPLVTPAIAAGMVIIFMQSLGSFGGNPYRVAAWEELTTATERADACTAVGSPMTF